MKAVVAIFIVYILSGIALFFFDSVDVHQLTDVFLTVPLYLFIPFAFLLLAITWKFNWKSKTDCFRAAMFLSFCFSIATTFWVYYLNMNIGVPETSEISGVVASTSLGRGKGKPGVVIRTETEDVSLSIKESEWERLSLGREYSIVLQKGIFGFYYKKKI